MTSYIPFKLLRSGFNINSKLVVANTKKLPGKISYLKGEAVKFLKLLGNQVSVEYKGGRIYVPIQYVLSYEQQTIITKPTQDDTCFVVYAKNDYFDIGAVFEATPLSSPSGLICYTADNRKIPINPAWIYALNSVAKPVKLTDLAMKFNSAQESKTVIPVELANETPVKIIETKPSDKKEDLKPTVYDYTSQDLNKFEMFKYEVDAVLSEEGDYFDISGRQHSTLLSCLKQNQFYIDIAYANTVIEISQKLIKDKDI